MDSDSDKDTLDYQPSILQGVFKKIDFLTFNFTCAKCKSLFTKTIPSDLASNVSCNKCGQLHLAEPQSLISSTEHRSN